MNERKIDVTFIASNQINLHAIALAVANQIKKGDTIKDDRRKKIS